jgi:TolA-binding protein
MKMKKIITFSLVLSVVSSSLFVSGCTDLTQAPATDMAELQNIWEESGDVVDDILGVLETYKAKVSELEKEVEAQKHTIDQLETAISTYQDRITELEAQLGNVLDAQTQETSPQSSTPLQEEQFRYRGHENMLTSVRVAILDALWDENKLTISWELTNASTRKIYLNLLKITAYDQMNIRGENEEGDTEFAIYPDLQDIQTPWPGEKVTFDSTLIFGPGSEQITIEFIVPDLFNDESIPYLTLTRS